jgi:molybdenum-dependent DNA-binding transcriptional regulator ModE
MHHQSANEEHDIAREQTEGGNIYQVNRGDGKFLNHRYEQFLHCLIRGGSIKSAAAAVNISYRTAIRWMHTPALQELYEEISNGLAEYERDRTQKAATLAMEGSVYHWNRKVG